MNTLRAEINDTIYELCGFHCDRRVLSADSAESEGRPGVLEL